MHAEAQFWNNLAETYASKPVELPDAFERKIAITQARMHPTDVVLDIGCGTGSLALRLAPHAAQVYGLDWSSEMVRIGREKAAAQGVDNVGFHVGAFDTQIPFEPESLDGVCAYSLLHLVRDPADAIAQIYALLKPGGFFVSSTACLADDWVPYRPLLAVMRWAGRAPFVQIMGRAELVAQTKAAGFVDVQLPDVGAKSTTAFMVATKPA